LRSLQPVKANATLRNARRPHPTAIQPDSAAPAITLAKMAGLILAITDIARELERLSEEMDGPLNELIRG